jgi:hypothetical protein
VNFLSNLKLRRKLLIAIAPLVLMVLVAGVHSSIQHKISDRLYSSLVTRDVGTLQNMDAARALTMRFGLSLYQLIAEHDHDRMIVIDHELDDTCTKFNGQIAEAVKENPDEANEIRAVATSFEKTIASSRAVRAAALLNQNEKAIDLMRGGVDAELRQTRQASMDVVDKLRDSLNRRSDNLTVQSHRAILITWFVIGFGLVASFALAAYILHTAIIRQLWALRDSIRDLASGQLDQSILYSDQNNEIGEISRALLTLQGVAKERDTDIWVKSETAATVVRLQSSSGFADFSTNLFSSISESIPLLCAVFYLADEPCTRLTCVGGFALGGPDQIREFALGQGLVGQTAVELRPFVMSINEEHKFRVPAGMGTVTPRSLLILPLVNQDVLIGVLQLATASRISGRQQAFLDALLPIVAMSAKILSGNIKTREIVENTRAQEKTLAPSVQLRD